MELNTTAPYHVCSNGSAEKAVQTVKFSMKNFCENSNSELITSNRFFIALQKYFV